MAEITRREKYLKAIGDGDSSGLPNPITRREYFLAKAAGMDVKTPKPITREEKYLANISGGGGGDIDVEAITITENGTTTAPEGTAYSPVNVNVPNTYEAGDEGKVVSSGALVAQTSTSVSQNGTVDTTLNNEVVVNVPNTYAAADEGKVVSNGALVAQTATSVTENGTIDTTLNNSVTVNVQAGGGGNGVLFLTQDANGSPLTAQVTGLTTIPARMFENYDTANGFYLNLTSVDLPSGVTSIGARAFRNCANLVTVNLPSGLTTIENRAFSYCSSLVITEIPANVRFFDEYTFNGCTSLTEIKFNSTPLGFFGYAFANCANVLKYDFTDCLSVPPIYGQQPFQNINANCKIIVPDSLYSGWIAAPGWSTWYASYIVKESEYTA